MAGATPITIVGNLTADPELRYTQNGLAAASFSVAVTPRTRNASTNEWEDGDATYFRCSVWREFAENVAGSLQKGARVYVQGTIEEKSYTNREGEERRRMEVTVEEMGPSLKYATAAVTKVVRNQNQGNRQQQRQAQRGGRDARPQNLRPAERQQQDPWDSQDGWAATDGGYEESVPF